MKTISLLVVVAALALIPSAAWAGQVDCMTATCDFNGLTAIDTVSGVMSPTSGAWAANFTENVYQNGSGVYIYVFELQITSITPGDSISSVSTGLGSSALNLFGSALNYGFVTNVSTGSGSFNFTPSTLQVNNLSGMTTTGATLEFYAESTLPPAAGTFNALDGGIVQTGSLDPAPEPGSLSLLGTGLLAMGGFLRKKLV